MAKKDELSAYDELLQLQAGVWEQVDKIKAEIQETDAAIVDLEMDTENALLLGKDPSKIESEMDALKAKRANLEKRITILESSGGSAVILEAAQAAIAENGEALKLVNEQWQKAVEKLDAAWSAYLEAVKMFRPLETKSSQLQSRREYCHKLLPRGTAFQWAEGVPETTRIQQQGGPVFKCMNPAAIKQAFES